MQINANTKIATVLKHHPGALEAIISISPRFSKLRNPLLRKLMATRTSLLMASKVGGCKLADFFEKLQPLGFVADTTAIPQTENERIEKPAFVSNVNPANLVLLDVRLAIEAGKDPFNMIMEQIKQLQAGMVLKLVNSFEPVPLIEILQKKGFEHYVEYVHDNEVNTYFYKTNRDAGLDDAVDKKEEGWDEVLKKYETNLTTIDVRLLDMPGPMLAILDALEKLPAGKALFVYHKRLPVFLLPQLKEKGFDYRIKEITEGQVQLIIFKN